MPDPAPPPLPLPDDEPADMRGGFAWFDGLLEGPVGDSPAMRALLPDLARQGLRSSGIDVEGNRFSLLAEDRGLALQGEKGLDLDRLVEGLNRIVALSRNPASCESTLRCTEVGKNRVRETLFAVKAGELARVTRVRAPRPEDLRRAPRVEGESSTGPAGRQKWLIGAALLIAGLLLAWQMHVHDLFFAPEAAELDLETGHFEKLLDVSVTDHWSGYEITFDLHPDFFETQKAIEAAEPTSRDDLARRKAARLVGGGNAIFVSLRDEEGNLLLERSLPLRSLLREEKTRLSLFLPARIGAESIHLEIARNLRHKNM